MSANPLPPIETDPSVPPNEVHLRDGTGNTVAKIVNVAAPHLLDRSEFIDRVALEIAKVWLDPKANEPSKAEAARLFKLTARAAIAAMREPSEAMLAAAEKVHGSPGFCDEPGDPPETLEIYQAMIDAALVEIG